MVLKTRREKIAKLQNKRVVVLASTRLKCALHKVVESKTGIMRELISSVSLTYLYFCVSRRAWMSARRRKSDVLCKKTCFSKQKPRKKKLKFRAIITTLRSTCTVCSRCCCHDTPNNTPTSFERRRWERCLTTLRRRDHASLAINQHIVFQFVLSVFLSKGNIENVLVLARKVNLQPVLQVVRQLVKVPLVALWEHEALDI